MKCDRNSIGLGPRDLEPREVLMEGTFYPLAAKEKNKRLLPVLSQLKEYFSPLAAKQKNNKKLLQGVQGGGFLEKSPPGRRYI
jgi:hypothetical protein